jgi:hypothetical protein
MKGLISAAAIMLVMSMPAQSGAWDRFASSRPPAPAADKKGSRNLAEKIKEMPARTRKSMSSVVGWSPIFDVEKIPLRAKDIYRINYESDGRPTDVFIDEFGEVVGDPGVK